MDHGNTIRVPINNPIALSVAKAINWLDLQQPELARSALCQLLRRL
jgi:hypothetical protein